MAMDLNGIEVGCNWGSLLNAPKCAFKVPTKYPPTLHLNEMHVCSYESKEGDMKHNRFCDFALNKEEMNNDSSLSTSGESEDDEQMPISILSILEKLV